MADYLQDFDFASDPVNIIHINDLILLKHLDCDFLARQGVRADFHLAEGAFAEVSAQLVMTNRRCAIGCNRDRGEALAFMHRAVRGRRCLST